MSKVFFGFALADGMFEGNCSIVRRVLTVEEAKSLVEQGVSPCLNLSHKATIDAMRSRYGIDVAIPETPPCKVPISSDTRYTDKLDLS